MGFRMKVAFIVAAMLAAGQAGATDKPLTEKQAVQLGAKMAMAAHTMGACEQYLPKEDADRFLAAITRYGDPREGEKSKLSALYAKWYARGRADSDQWSTTECRIQLERDLEEIRAVTR